MEKLIKRLKVDLIFVEEFHDMDSRSWGSEEGILISGNEAKVIIKALEEFSKNKTNAGE